MSVTIQEQELRDLFASCADVQVQRYSYGAEPHVKNGVLFLYCTGLVDSFQINQVVLPQLEQNKALPLLPVSMEENRKEIEHQIVLKVFAGELLLFFDRTGELFTLNISKVPQRQTEESTYDVSIKGARDAFTESIETNVGLLRKRVRNTTLCNESFVVGKRSQTKVSLLYLSDVINEEVLEEARKRLNSVDVDIVNGVSPLEDLLVDSPLSLLPLINYVTRPDYVVESLQRGRFCILIDGAPAALIAPINFHYLIKSSEDAFMPYFYVTFERLLRYFGFFISGFLPGIYLAFVSFHQDQLPLPVLATISLNSYGIPISPSAELFLMLLLFELLREAGVRLPKPVGPTVTVVGGLIVGDAAIRSGVASPNVVVVAAITLMSQYVLTNQSLGTAVILIRVYIMLWSCVLGLFGLMIAHFSVILYLTTLKSFGVSYVPDLIDPLSINSIKSFIQFPKAFPQTTPKFLRTKSTQKNREEKK